MAKLFGRRTARRANGSAATPSILIVDESTAVARLEAAVATASGWRVKTTESASEAVELLRTRAFDVVIIGSPVHVDEDTLMLDLLQGELQHVARRVIVLTAWVHDARIRTRAARAEVFAVMAKPFDIETLARTMVDCAANDGAAGPTLWLGVTEPAVASPPEETESTESLAN